jgi:paraquat-inducible protein B
LNPKEKPTADIPRAKIKRRARVSFLWLVPVAAAIVAAWLVFAYYQKMGPVVTIQFKDGNGLQANQTVLKYRGVRIGSVRSVELSKDMQYVMTTVRLNRSAENLAREGTLFWIVRPEVVAGGLHGLETIVSGPFIQAQPGKENAKKQKSFIGAEQAPLIDPNEHGLEVIVTTPEMRTLSVGSAVYYRGIEVGSVKYFQLSDDATNINVHLLIKTNFAPLVRTDTKFWNAGGIDLQLKLFGIDLSAQSLKSLVMGGIAFATPLPPGRPATNGSVFQLYEKVDEKWVKWSPDIAITNSVNPGTGPSPVILNGMGQQ